MYEVCVYVRYSGQGAVGDIAEESGVCLAEVEDSASIRHVEPVTPEALEPTS